MNINEVIKYPLLSEKTYAQMAEGVYTFVVDKRTNRKEVKNVVEYIFDVKVKKVNIHNYDKKPKKLGRYEGFTNQIKKAVIYLAEGQINIFPEEAAEEVPKEIKDAKVSSKDKAQPKKEISDAEKRAAEKIAAKLKEKSTETKEAPAKEVKKEKPAEEIKPEIKKEKTEVVEQKIKKSKEENKAK